VKLTYQRMGKKNKEKKKGKGAEKTAAKTDKKVSNKIKKELQKLGEEDIESIISQIEKDEKKRLEVTECAVEAPTRRLNFTFIPHPDKDQLILYGGEFYNGQKVRLHSGNQSKSYNFAFSDVPIQRPFFLQHPNRLLDCCESPRGAAPPL
jgi:hypothetical protein